MCNADGKCCLGQTTQYDLMRLECSHILCPRCVGHEWSDSWIIYCPLCYLLSTRNIPCDSAGLRSYLRQYGRSNQESLKKERKVKGLPSIDNSCFINVVIQVLAQTPRFFQSLFHADTTIQSSPLIESLVNVISDINNADTAEEPFCRADDLQRIRHVVAKKDPSFYEFMPNDSHAFFLSLLEMLQSDYTAGPAAIFQGELCYSLRCATCHHIYSDKIDQQEFYCLNVPVTSNIVSIKDELSRLKDQACITDHCMCPRCSNHSEVLKVMEISRYPNVLVLLVSKYYMVENNGQWDVHHLHDDVIIPSSVSVQDAQNGVYNYTLYGIISHDGPMDEGHYTAHVRKLSHECSEGEWYHCDDFNVTKCNVESEAHLNNAYIIFYFKETP